MRLVCLRQPLQCRAGTRLRVFAVAALGLWVTGRAQSQQIAAPAEAPRIRAMEQLPGLYKVASQGGLVCDVYLILTPEPVLIDCGSRPGWEQLVTNLALLDLEIPDVDWVIATHGHWDHVDNMARIHRENPKARFAIHAGDAQFVISNDRVFSCAEPLYEGVASDPIKVDRILLDGDTLAVGTNTFHIIHTPGHTPGSITIVTQISGKKVGFCGDAVTGYYALMNRSSVIDWEQSMKRLMGEGIEVLYAGHRKKPVSGRTEVEAYLRKSLDAATFKRSKLARDEMYQDLVYSLEHENAPGKGARPAPGRMMPSVGILAGLEKAGPAETRQRFYFEGGFTYERPGLERVGAAEVRERLAQAAVDAGIYWTRQSFEWRAVEKAPRNYDWMQCDQAVETAERFGIHILGLITTSPLGHAPATEAELEQFDRYVRAVVARYKGRVRYWEIWNEPNLRMFWNPRADARAYAAALRVAYRACKETDPDSVVLGMATLGIDTGFIRRALEAGATNSFDILSVHPYRDLREIDLNNDRPGVTMREDMRIVRNLLQEFGRSAPIWFTEMGRNTSLAPEGEGVSWRAQADYTVQMHVMALATGVEKLFQYELYAPATTPENKEYYYGILNPDYTPKTAYYALRTMTSKLGGLAYRGAVLPEDPYARGYLFGDAGRSVVVLWSEKPQARVSLRVGSATVEVTDFEGRAQSVTSAEGLVVVPLSSSPVYLEGADRETLERACALDVALPWQQTPSDEWSRLVCMVTNPVDRPVAWSLRATAPRGLSVRIRPHAGVLAARSVQAVEVEVRPGRGVYPGDVVPLPFDLQMTCEGTNLAPVTKTLHIPVDPGWLICGPFPNPGPDESRPPGAAPTDTGLFIDHLAGAGGEAQIEPRAGQSHPGALGQNARAIWTPCPLDQRGFIDFRRRFEVRRNATAYAYRRVYSERDRLVRVLLGSDDGIRVWVNHQEVFCKHVHREAHVGQDVLTVALRRGWNSLLIKVDQGSWGWGAYVEIEDDKSRVSNQSTK